MAHGSYLSRIAGTEPAPLVLKPPRVLFAPTAPAVESAPPLEALADPPTVPAAAALGPFVHPLIPAVAAASTLPKNAPAVAAPQQHVAPAQTMPDLVVPVDQHPGGADEPVVREVVKPSERVVRLEVPPVAPEQPKKADDAFANQQVKVEFRVVAAPYRIPAPPEPAPVRPVMVGRPPDLEVMEDAAAVEKPTAERVETRPIRLEPMAAPPPAPTRDAGEPKTRVRIGSLEVRIVHEAPASAAASAAASQAQASPPAPVRTPAQALSSAPLSRGFRAFGLAQG
jgi:hypothetical protein